MSDNGHAFLSASAASRWSRCAASLRTSAGIVDKGSAYADEGTAAHTLGQWALENGKDPAEYPEKTITVENRGGEDTVWPVTQEMIEAVRKYVAEVAAHVADGGQLLVEQRVDYRWWLGLEKHTVKVVDPESGALVEVPVTAFGTSDSVILHDDRITIVDLKYGMGVKVDAEDNEQLMLYALGALYEYEMLGDFREVTMVICQPRIDHVSRHTIDVTSLKTFALNMKAAAHKAIELFNAEAPPAIEHHTPDEKACRWCRAKATCPALAAEVQTETRDLFAGIVVDAQIPDDVLARAMSKVGLIEDWCKAVRAECERRLLAGQPVPGFKLVQGRRGPRQWTDKDEVERLLKSFRLKQDEMYDFSLISPTTAEKRLKESPKRWEKLQALISQSDGKPSVAPEDDKRPQITVSSVTDAFAALAQVDGEEFV